MILTIYGISLISNGIFPMGDPMHGIYGVGLTFMLAPFVSCYELKGYLDSKHFFTISILAGALIFLKFWLLLVDLDRTEFRGLSQRIGALIGFGWVGYLAYNIDKITT